LDKGGEPPRQTNPGSIAAFQKGGFGITLQGDMKPNFRTCPQCSTRNRLDKEFCVKCGEALKGVKAGDPGEETKKSKPGFFVTAHGQDASPMVALVLFVMALVMGIAAWRVIRSAELPSTTPDPALAQNPRVSPAAVEAATLAPGPRDYVAGMVALRAGDFAGAIKLLRLAIAAENRADYRLGLAEALEKSGATAEGLAEYERAASLDRTNARFASEWARALTRGGRNPEAIQAWEAALKIDPQNLAALGEVSNLHINANDLARARPYLERIVQLQPTNLVPRQSLAQALEAAHDLDGAARQYREILSARPDALVSRLLLSEVLVKQNRPQDAIRLLDEGLGVDPKAAILYREKGRVFDRLERNPEAIAAYREYIRRAPEATDLRMFTARIEQLQALMEQ